MNVLVPYKPVKCYLPCLFLLGFWFLNGVDKKGIE